MFDGSHTGSVNGTGTPIVYGELVRITGPNLIGRMQADTLPHLAGYLGVSRSGVANPGGYVDACIEGITPILLETGLTPLAGDTLYVSATVAGRATNVAPANVFVVGTVKNASSYLLTKTVNAVVGVGGGAGAQGAQGGTGGAQGAQGGLGAQGSAGAPSVALKYGMFYGLTAGTGNGGSTDYASTVAVKTSAGTGRVPFPRLGPTSATGIVAIDASSFTLPDIGTYEITFRVHTTEPGQLQLELNGAAQPQTTAGNSNPTSGGHPIIGSSFLTTVGTNAVLAVINPAGNSPALTITPADGASTNAQAQTITIKRIA